MKRYVSVRFLRMRVVGGVAGQMLAASVAAQAPSTPARLTAPSWTTAGASAGVRPSLVFDGVAVVDVEQGKLLRDQRVVVVGTHIQAVGSAASIKVPADARVVDGRGKYLIPGLWDAHVHPQARVDIAYPSFIANGVTGIRDAGSPVPLDTLRLWRHEILTGTRVGPPRQILSGRSLAYVPSCRDRAGFSATAMCAFDSADARYLVDSIKAAGADMVKPWALPVPVDEAVADEARRIGIPVGGHAENMPPIDASDRGFRIIDHMQYGLRDDIGKGISTTCWAGQPSASIDRCRPIADRFRKNGTWLVPTLFVFFYDGSSHTYLGGGERARAVGLYFTSVIRPGLASSTHHGNWFRDTVGRAGDTLPMPSLVTDSGGSMRVMRQTDLPIVAGTDAPPWGFSLPVELAMLVVEGFTPLEALQAATLNPAKMWHATDSLGTVAAGKLADLVLLDANPLDDITNTTAIRAVIANGRYFDRDALDRLLADVRRLEENP